MSKHIPQAYQDLLEDQRKEQLEKEARIKDLERFQNFKKLRAEQYLHDFNLLISEYDETVIDGVSISCSCYDDVSFVELVILDENQKGVHKSVVKFTSETYEHSGSICYTCTHGICLCEKRTYVLLVCYINTMGIERPYSFLLNNALGDKKNFALAFQGLLSTFKNDYDFRTRNKL